MKLKFFCTQFVLVSVLLATSSALNVRAEQAPPFMPVTSVKRLSQGWSQWESDWFHSITQGSKFMPYAFYVALEQAGNQEPLNSAENLEKFRCIPQPATASNPDHLPIGFVADPCQSLPRELLKDTRSIGFTCAACHTAQINYNGKGLLIDGGPTLADMDALLVAIKDAVVATASNSEKFSRFAKKVLGDEDSATKRTLLKAQLRLTAAGQRNYVAMNETAVPYGFARMDAFGRIFNNALVAVRSNDRIEPWAPVSYPFLWNTVQADTVQWTGNATNGLIGSLGRNVGEVVGVFGEIDTNEKPLPHGYASSLNFKNLKRIEKSLHGLKSPSWPEDVLGKLDSQKVKAGAEIFKRLRCDHCHPKINFFSWLPFVDSFKSHLTRLDDTPEEEGVHTDPTAAALIRDSRANSGALSGQRKLFSVLEKYSKTEPVSVITEDTVLRTLIGDVENKKLPSVSAGKVLLLGNGLNEYGDLDELMPMTAERKVNEDANTKIQLVYRARPLDGIWATGPFLHNGSVPTLFDLLLPEAKRPVTFAMGNREFDPVKVGAVTTPTSETHIFNTRLKGNSNKGHNYGTSELTDDERLQLVEYLKSL
ncbi:MAG: hypothetical protein B7Z37_15635 [Verrucomicrobia bacterium 12-59-8]|nr:MAG: hypothetical protein B7Z37_15635 [Verrucomicrobia bacterium 12-59-8]